MPSAKEWENHDLARDWTAIRQLRLEVSRVVEKMRQAGRVGSQLECSVSVSASESDPRMQTLLFPHNRSFSELPDVFRCSSAEIVDLEDDIENAEQFKADCQRSMGTNEAPINITLVLTSAKGHKCPRCWKYAPEVDVTETQLCMRRSQTFVASLCTSLSSFDAIFLTGHQTMLLWLLGSCSSIICNSVSMAAQEDLAVCSLRDIWNDPIISSKRWHAS
ncbi:hypothetical protein PsorP6_010570 [Peronosclerospora sorghi]|uniref:Uncharacterized protein n=1 Tax=Peronosclerospora sorghi TaxID=230839 RepID=A0ACC0VUR5_9STRA|nr:hypothetical protein PsorP6_010570 [Peronosclerospora sorghi]